MTSESIDRPVRLPTVAVPSVAPVAASAPFVERPRVPTTPLVHVRPKVPRGPASVVRANVTRLDLLVGTVVAAVVWLILAWFIAFPAPR